MLRRPAIAAALFLLAGGCAARSEAPDPPDPSFDQLLPVARYDTCDEMWRDGWPEGVREQGSERERRVYDRNLHLAFDIGHACRRTVGHAEQGVGRPARGQRWCAPGGWDCYRDAESTRRR